MIALQLVLTVGLGGEGIGKPSTVVSTDEAANMTSTPTIEVIRTSIVTRKIKGVIRKETLAL